MEDERCRNEDNRSGRLHSQMTISVGRQTTSAFASGLHLVTHCSRSSGDGAWSWSSPPVGRRVGEAREATIGGAEPLWEDGHRSIEDCQRGETTTLSGGEQERDGVGALEGEPWAGASGCQCFRFPCRRGSLGCGLEHSHCWQRRL